jgi:SecD/SecF fusion protein
MKYIEKGTSKMKNNSKNKSIAGFVLIIIAIFALAFIAWRGVNGHNVNVVEKTTDPETGEVVTSSAVSFKYGKGAAANIKLGLDLAGGVSITYEADKDNPTSTEMSDTVYKLQKRVENYSTESEVRQEGTNRITVDIPGVTNANEILEALGKAGSIEFIDPDGNVVIDGSDIADAQAATTQDQTTGLNEYVVQLELNKSGRKKFAKATKKYVGQQISIVYDGETISSPVVNEAITTGEAQISGQETYAEADELASTIRIGALPLELHEVQSNTRGAKLGEEALRTSLMAGFIGFILIIIFMCAYYRVPGLAASIALTLYVVLVLVALNVLDVTLTLPGIGGIILSIGMAVDANVIIFQRIREELADGKTITASMKTGFDKALSAIVDGNVTTLIAAIVLWVKGSGTVKGFAQTLFIGIILSMFTALFVTRTILNALYYLGLNKVSMFGVQKQVKVFDFVGNRMKFFAISGVMILLCVAALIFNKATIGNVLNYGLDFKGGTSTKVTLNSDVSAVDEQKAVAELMKETVGDTPETAVIEDENAVSLKTVELDLTKREAVTEAFEEKYGIPEEQISIENISGSVSSEMKSDAVVSVIIATIFMLIYIWIRFKDFNFGASAVLALMHDVICVLLVYAAARISVGNTFIACMLTIVGYSINATIVIFDRIRETLHGKRSEEALKEVVNASISSTFSRSINTSLTTFIMVFMLAVMGVEDIRAFAIPLMAGIICGGYSSICITGNLWFVLKTRFSKKK